MEIMKFLKKMWLFLIGGITLLPNWLPENTRYELFNKVVINLKLAVQYKAPASRVLAVVFFILGILYLIFGTRRSNGPIEKKYMIGAMECRVSAPNKSAIGNPNKISTVARCAKDSALIINYSGRDDREYLCQVCKFKWSPEEYDACKREAEGRFVREHDHL